MKTASLFYIKLLILALVITIFLGCSKNDVITYDLTGSWKVVSIVDDNSKKITKTEDNTWPDFNNGDITIKFEEPDINGQGIFSGINVTNGYSGEYTVKENGNIITGSITTTFINEPEWVRLFKISDLENYEVRNSNLILYRNNKRSNITFVRN